MNIKDGPDGTSCICPDWFSQKLSRTCSEKLNLSEFRDFFVTSFHEFKKKYRVNSPLKKTLSRKQKKGKSEGLTAMVKIG